MPHLGHIIVVHPADATCLPHVARLPAARSPFPSCLRARARAAPPAPFLAPRTKCMLVRPAACHVHGNLPEQCIREQESRVVPRAPGCTQPCGMPRRESASGSAPTPTSPSSRPRGARGQRIAQCCTRQPRACLPEARDRSQHPRHTAANPDGTDNLQAFETCDIQAARGHARPRARCNTAPSRHGRGHARPRARCHVTAASTRG